MPLKGCTQKLLNSLCWPVPLSSLTQRAPLNLYPCPTLTASSSVHWSRGCSGHSQVTRLCCDSEKDIPKGADPANTISRWHAVVSFRGSEFMGSQQPGSHVCVCWETVLFRKSTKSTDFGMSRWFPSTLPIDRRCDLWLIILWSICKNRIWTRTIGDPGMGVSGTEL